MDLSVITVTHHSKDYIEDQIFSLMMSCFRLRFEHIIVDNASMDGTPALIEERFSKQVTLIKNDQNVGFSKANNQALQIAKGRYLLFLNPDMCIKEGDLDTFIKWMDERPDVGLAGCKLLDPMGKECPDGQPRPFPRLGGSLLWLLRLDSQKKQKRPDVSPPEEVEAVKGAFLLVRREVLEKLGWGFDPRYFLLFEDTDLCREVNRLGYKNIHYPNLACVDYVSRSFALKSGKWIYREFTKSMLAYFRKWHPWYQSMLIAMAIPIGLLLRLSSKNHPVKK
ncbi:MAG TPA: glycosyltransferase family 2 protein [Rhabdochlamydiaceae bacterium]|nr:glycosyltransferase family 2 protein [Rhabdochlamydiaceae bacterium]